MSARAKQVMFGYIQTQSVFAAVKLGVADALDAGPKSAVALGEELGANPDTLGRLIDVLIRLGLFTKTEAGYAHNDNSRTLSSAHPNSLADLLLFCGVESYKTFGNLTKAVQTGDAVFADAWGQPFWDHLNEHTDRRATFARAMERQSEELLQKLAADVDFNAYPRVIDVGGGKGQFFRPLSAGGFTGEGLVFDLPALTEAAAGFLAESNLGNVQFQPGSFFDGVPEGGDLYVLKFVIHDWNDADSVKILKQVKAAMKPGARLMLVELFLGGDPSPWSFLSDMLMLTTFGAAERSDAHFRLLMAQAGLEVDAVEHIAGAHYYMLAH